MSADCGPHRRRHPHRACAPCAARCKGIPHRAGSFRNTHDNLARDVAFLMVQLDSARGQFRGR